MLARALGHRRMAGYHIGIDIGGTFTDCFVTDGTRSWSAKAPTTPAALDRGLAARLRQAGPAGPRCQGGSPYHTPTRRGRTHRGARHLSALVVPQRRARDRARAHRARAPSAALRHPLERSVSGGTRVRADDGDGAERVLLAVVLDLPRTDRARSIGGRVGRADRNHAVERRYLLRRRGAAPAG